MPFAAAEGGVRVHVKLAPKAAADRIGPVHASGEGAVLKVAVTAAPERGRANAAMIALLAKAWGVPKSSLSVIKGETDRNKTLFVEGDADALLAKMAASAGHKP